MLAVACRTQDEQWPPLVHNPAASPITLIERIVEVCACCVRKFVGACMDPAATAAIEVLGGVLDVLLGIESSEAELHSRTLAASLLLALRILEVDCAALNKRSLLTIKALLNKVPQPDESILAAFVATLLGMASQLTADVRHIEDYLLGLATAAPVLASRAPADVDEQLHAQIGELIGTAIGSKSPTTVATALAATRAIVQSAGKYTAVYIRIIVPRLAAVWIPALTNPQMQSPFITSTIPMLTLALSLVTEQHQRHALVTLLVPLLVSALALVQPVLQKQAVEMLMAMGGTDKPAFAQVRLSA